MLHTKYQVLGLEIQTRRVFVCSILAYLCKSCDPRAVPFVPKEYNLHKLGRGLLVNSIY